MTFHPWHGRIWVRRVEAEEKTVPMRQIVENAGAEGWIIVGKLREKPKKEATASAMPAGGMDF